MPSPFPGMDPYLEVQPRWEFFHGWFIRQLAQLTFPKAVALECWIDVEREYYVADPSGEHVVIDDWEVEFTTTGQKPTCLEVGFGVDQLTGPRAVREVVRPVQTERRRQEYLVVRDNPSWPRDLAVIRLLSRANKAGPYASTYRAERAKLLASLPHFMEIDFLRGGDNPSRKLFPDLAPTPYFAFVARKNTIGRNEEGYPIRLQEPLPTIGLPLRASGPDLPLDLAVAFRSAYELTVGIGRPIHYQNEPVPQPALTPEDAAWTSNLIAAAR